MLRNILIKLTPVRHTRIARVGNVALDEMVFVLEEASPQDANINNIKYQNLLPHRTSEYITIAEAHHDTGMSKSNLRRIARKNLIEAMMVQNTWLLLRSSLYDYISNTGYRPQRRRAAY